MAGVRCPNVEKWPKHTRRKAWVNALGVITSIAYSVMMHFILSRGAKMQKQNGIPKQKRKLKT